MVILEKSNRLHNIENKFGAPIRDLLYQMHWLEDMRHRDIAVKLNLPRPTITKWFHRLQVPTQSCRRFTDKNLTSWFYKTCKLQKKPRYGGLGRRIQRIGKMANVDFFKKWSAEMAYILGYFAADGCMFTNPRGSKYVSFASTDSEILEKVKIILSSGHKIGVRKRCNKNWKDLFSLQIGSKEMYNDLIKLGFMPDKAARFKLPKIPPQLLRHFIRGYFDGDGSIIYGYFIRKDRSNKNTPYVLTCFASANSKFLESLSVLLVQYAGTRKGYIDKKREHLSYSKNDSIKLFNYIYKDVPREQYLERKYRKFSKAVNIGAVA